MNKKDKRMLAFMLNDKLKFNINELVSYIEDNYSSMDIFNIRKNYIYVQPNGESLESILEKFIQEQAIRIDEYNDDIALSINENVTTIFFDITKKDDTTYIIERMRSN